MNTVPLSEWIERCAERIVQLDRQIASNEAHGLARELHLFERTAAMVPEAAVDFVLAELAQPAPRFERRAEPRA
jgi:hypothetical protein